MLEIDIKLLPLQGVTNERALTQGVASLALGYVLHWAFSPSLLNPKLQYVNKYVKLYAMYVLALSDYKQMFKACCCRGLQTRPPIRQRKCSYLSNIP